MDLVTYKGLCEQYRGLSKEVEGYTESLQESKDGVERLSAEYKIKLASIVGDKSNYIKDRIRVACEEATRTDKEERSVLLFKRDSLKSKNFVPDEESVRNFYAEYFDLLNRFYAALKDREEESKKILPILRTPKSNSSDVTNIEEAYEKLSDGLAALEQVDRIIEEKRDDQKVKAGLGVLGDTIKSLPKESRLLFYIILVIGIVFVVYTNPLVVILPTTIMSAMYYRKAKTRKRKSLAFLMELKKYRGLARKIAVVLKEKVESTIRNQRAEFEQSKAKSLEDLESRLSTVGFNISETESKITKSIMESSESANFEQDQRMQISKYYEERLSSMKSELMLIEQSFDEVKAEFEKITQEREEGKKSIDEQYFNLSKVGTNKILPDDFLLGFDDYDPITLSMSNYCAHLISTVKSNKTIFTDFVKMCVIQILVSMNPSCVHIYIADVENGTSRFGIFGSLEKQGILKILKTEEEVREVIEDLYQLKSDRDKEITAVEDSITEYNERMIKNYGLTEPYHIFISSHDMRELLLETKYLQLNDAGNMGIAIIGVWNKTLFEFLASEEEALGKAKIDFFKLILDMSKKTNEDPDDGTTCLSSISGEGIIINIKRQELETKRKLLNSTIQKSRR